MRTGTICRCLAAALIAAFAAAAPAAGQNADWDNRRDAARAPGVGDRGGLGGAGLVDRAHAVWQHGLHAHGLRAGPR